MRASCLEWSEYLTFCLEKQKVDPTGEDQGKVIRFQIQGMLHWMLYIALCAFLSKFFFFFKVDLFNVYLIFIYIYEHNV